MFSRRGYEIYNTCAYDVLTLSPPPPSLSPGNVAREEMMKSKLPNSVLRRIWALSDIDNDGQLDKDEFALAMFLLDHKLAGNDIPDVLPEKLVPPSKRMLFKSQHFGGGGGGGMGGASGGGRGDDMGGVSTSGYSSGGGYPGKGEGWRERERECDYALCTINKLLTF